MSRFNGSRRLDGTPGGRTRPTGGELPPHDVEAEAAVLGCVLENNGCMEKMRERFQGRGQAFYVLAHQEILRAMSELDDAGKPIDTITLKDQLGPDKVMSCGGLSYIAGLLDHANSAAIEHYLEIVWEKYLARLKLQEATETTRVIRQKQGLHEADVARLEQWHEEWKRLSEAGTVTPQLLAEPKEFYEDFLRIWFRLKGEEPGWRLAVPLADLRVREHELIIFTAENGAGKTTYLGQLAVALGVQGVRVMVASLEEHVPETLHMLSRQLLGLGTDRLEQNEGNQRVLADALAWMNKRFLFYNYLGIGNWRDILDCCRYARSRREVNVFILDSFMKMGLADDDYAGQSVAVNAFHDFCLATGACVILVVHQNKAEGGASAVKRKVRGAGQITDVANVLMSIRRNEKKEAKKDELKQQWNSDKRIVKNAGAMEGHRKAAQERIEGYREDWRKLKLDWDSEVRLIKQRKKGSQQNASRKMWFDRVSQQFRGRPLDGSLNYLGMAAADFVARVADHERDEEEVNYEEA